MSQPRLPLSDAKLRHARGVLAIATAVAGLGSLVTVASGGGLWTLGLAAWAAIVVAIVLGAGTDNALAIVGRRGAGSALPGSQTGADDGGDHR